MRYSSGYNNPALGQKFIWPSQQISLEISAPLALPTNSLVGICTEAGYKQALVYCYYCSCCYCLLSTNSSCTEPKQTISNLPERIHGGETSSDNKELSEHHLTVWVQPHTGRWRIRPL